MWGFVWFCFLSLWVSVLGFVFLRYSFFCLFGLVVVFCVLVVCLWAGLMVLLDFSGLCVVVACSNRSRYL